MAQSQARCATDQQIEQSVVAAHSPQGFNCARCACKCFFLTRNGLGRQLEECLLCGYQSSSIVGTVMENTKLPLTVSFLAMCRITQHRGGISALELKRHLGVSYKSAWLVEHKLMQTMAQHDAAYRLQGRAEIDDAYLGGERARSINGGRMGANKSAFLAAVQTLSGGRPCT